MRNAMRADQLKAYQGRRVRLVFNDDHIVVAHLLGVYSEDDEVMYEVIEVEKVGPVKYANLKPGTIAVGPSSEIKSFTVMDSGP
jgi:hypothetical protein